MDFQKIVLLGGVLCATFSLATSQQQYLSPYQINGNHEQYQRQTIIGSPTPRLVPVSPKSPRNIRIRERAQPQLANALPLGVPYVPRYSGAIPKRVTPQLNPTYAPQEYQTPVPQVQSGYQQQQQQSPRFIAQYEPRVIQYQREPQYVNRIPVNAVVRRRKPKKVAVRVPISQPVKEEQPEQEEDDVYPADPNPQYSFSFDVKDDDLTNYQNRHEERDGGVIKGSYSVIDPDGFVRTVTYTADSKNGFQAKVTREPTDVKIKFPVPITEPPQEAPKPARIAAVPRYNSAASPYPSQYQSQVPQFQGDVYAQPDRAYGSTSRYAQLPTAQTRYAQRRALRQY